MKILHIDDDALAVSLIKGELKLMGHTVDTFLWPQRNPLPDVGQYDLLIIDCIMPPGGLSQHGTREGYLTGILLHKETIGPKYPQVPVIILSALPPGTRARKEASDYAKEAGIRYLEKPIVRPDLRQAINSVEEDLRKTEQPRF